MLLLSDNVQCILKAIALISKYPIVIVFRSMSSPYYKVHLTKIPVLFLTIIRYHASFIHVKMFTSPTLTPARLLHVFRRSTDPRIYNLTSEDLCCSFSP